MYKFEVGQLVEYKRSYKLSKYPKLDFNFIRAPVEHRYEEYNEDIPLMIGKMGIVMSRYPSQRSGDTAFQDIDFDRENIYIVYFQEEMTEYMCFEPELGEP